MTTTKPEPQPRPPEAWSFPQPISAGKIALIIIAVLLLWQTGKRVEIDRFVGLSVDAVVFLVGQKPDSQVASGFGTLAKQLVPIVLEERTETSRIEHFDRAHLPPFSHIETTQTKVQTLNPETFKLDTSYERHEMLVEPYGYAFRVGWKLLETLEIALWGTLLAVIIGLPLAIFGARNLTPNGFVRGLSRSVVSLLRAVPELISALFLVLAYGFGPIAGVLALALHAAGFFRQILR